MEQSSCFFFLREPGCKIREKMVSRAEKKKKKKKNRVKIICKFNGIFWMRNLTKVASNNKKKKNKIISENSGKKKKKKNSKNTGIFSPTPTK